MNDDALKAELRLALTRGVGPRLRQALLDRFGSAAEVLRATESALKGVRGIGPEVVAALKDSGVDVDGELACCREHGIAILARGQSGYPPLLGEIFDPPGILFLRGELLPADRAAVAIVGTRRATRYGLNQAERFAAGLARAGVTVVSGLAFGIDAAAHRGALAAGGRTVAVLGGGLLNLYPAEHRNLADEVAAHGALVSELPPRFPVRREGFPQRNRVISGMSLGVLVVEAPRRSGALITAAHAVEQGREVFALPGPIDSPASGGCHGLIRDGAKLVESVDDILEELQPLLDAAGTAAAPTSATAASPPDQPPSATTAPPPPIHVSLDATERRVFELLSTQPISIDQVIAASQLPAQQVLATLSGLELRKLVQRQSGNLVARR